MDHSNKNSSGSESNASVICKGYSFSNLAEPVQIHRETYTRTATIQTPVTGDTNGMTRQSVRKPHMNDHHLHRRCFKIDRVGGGITPAVLSHHRTCGSAYGGFGLSHLTMCGKLFSAIPLNNITSILLSDSVLSCE